jgi:hypothetical protein
MSSTQQDTGGIENLMTTTLIMATQLVVNKNLQEWERAKEDLEKLISYAFLNKENLPPNYWQAEHKAKLKYEAAAGILEALIRAS